jgi:TetR/AcrR family transcriptional regulator
MIKSNDQMIARGRTPASGARERERRDPAATREALLRAGEELFSARGFDGVSIGEIAERAGVNKALISYHFRGKRGLYAAVLESTFAEMAAHVEAIEAGAEDAAAALHGLLEAFARVARERPGFPTLFLREVLATGIEPTVLPYLLRIIGVSRRLAERGVREGLFRRVDPVLLHFALVGSIVFFFSTERARQRAVADGLVPFRMPDPAAFVRFLEETTLRGLAPSDRPSGPRRSPSHRRKGARA